MATNLRTNIIEAQAAYHTALTEGASGYTLSGISGVLGHAIDDADDAGVDGNLIESWRQIGRFQAERAAALAS